MAEKKRFTSAELGVEPAAKPKKRLTSAELGVETLVQTPEERSALSKVVSLVAEPATKAVETIGAPFAALDKVTAAPVRAGIGAAQEGGNILDIVGAAADQFKAGLPSATGQGELLPTTPEMSDLAYKGMTKGGVRPEFAASMAPVMGIAADVALDPTMLIPGRPATKGLEAIGDAARATGRGLAKGALAAEKAATSAIARTGQVVTGGALKADKALRMYKELNAMEMMFPGTQEWGKRAVQAQKLGQMREALQGAKIEVPGSHDVALNIMSEIQKAQGRTISNPQSVALLDFIKERAFERQTAFDPQTGAVLAEELKPRDLTLDELDDVVRNLDSLSFNPSGNPKVLKAIYGPAIQKSRAMADEILQTVPEGELLKDEKRRFEALATAGAKRSRLIEAGTNIASLGTAVYTALDPVAFLTTRALVPGTYVKALAAVRMPRDAAEMLAKAQASGSVTLMRDAIQSAAQRYPRATERLIRGTVLLTGKPDGMQTLSEDEIPTLAQPKSFDPEVIAQERARIQSDESIPSIEKAKQLSAINKNGYVNLPAPQMAASEPTPVDQVFGGQVGLEDLVKSLERTQ